MNDVIYLDNNATTRPYPEVVETMEPFYTERFGNPSSVHQMGRDAKNALDQARKQAAEALGARSPVEVLFVSCATEANALAINGVVRNADRETPHVVTSEVEHPSVLETLRALEEEGEAEVSFLSVNEKGRVSPSRIRDAIDEETVLVTIMTANNEVGTLQPVADISEICREREVLFHTDAVQAPGKIPLDVCQPPVDLLSLSAHKFHGPRGIGILYRRKEVELAPLFKGGGQEEGLRGGTEATGLAAGIAKALELATRRQPEVSEKMKTLRSRLYKGLREQFGDGLIRHTPKEKSLPNTLNVSFPEVEADALLIRLDLEDICVSAGSACHSGAIEMSHVLEAMGVSQEVGLRSVRFSLSGFTTEEEVNRVLEKISGEGTVG